MLEDTFLRWLVVVRTYRKQAVNTGKVSRTDKLCNMPGIVAAYAEHDRKLLRIVTFYKLQYLILLLTGCGRRLAGSTHNHIEVNASLCRMAQKLLHSLKVDLAVCVKWRDQGNACAEKLLHFGYRKIIVYL